MQAAHDRIERAIEVEHVARPRAGARPSGRRVIVADAAGEHRIDAVDVERREIRLQLRAVVAGGDDAVADDDDALRMHLGQRVREIERAGRVAIDDRGDLGVAEGGRRAAVDRHDLLVERDHLRVRRADQPDELAHAADVIRKAGGARAARVDEDRDGVDRIVGSRGARRQLERARDDRTRADRGRRRDRRREVAVRLPVLLAQAVDVARSVGRDRGDVRGHAIDHGQAAQRQSIALVRKLLAVRHDEVLDRVRRDREHARGERVARCLLEDRGIDAAMDGVVVREPTDRLRHDLGLDHAPVVLHREPRDRRVLRRA